MAAKPLPDQHTLLQLLRYDPQTGKLFWRRAPCIAIPAGSEALTSTTAKGYKRGGVMGRKVMAHRVIWKMVNGYDPIEIDHEDGNKSNNRLTNLRDATRIQNNRNSSIRPANRSGRVGVHFRRGYWIASIRYAGKQHELGYFKDFEKACARRAAAEIEHGYHPNHGRKSH